MVQLARKPVHSVLLVSVCKNHVIKESAGRNSPFYQPSITCLAKRYQAGSFIHVTVNYLMMGLYFEIKNLHYKKILRIYIDTL